MAVLEIHKAHIVKNDVVVNVIAVYVRREDVFKPAAQNFIGKLFSDLVCLFRRGFAGEKACIRCRAKWGPGSRAFCLVHSNSISAVSGEHP